MLSDNLQEYSFTEAVQRTFDGQHPCRLCSSITEGKKSEKKTEFTLQLKKLEFISARPVFVFSPPNDFRLQPETLPAARGIVHKPLLLPPRGDLS